MNLKGRVQKLERVQSPAGLPHHIRRWLGLPLTEAESIEADRLEAEAKPFDREAVANDPTLSTEVKTWLLQA